MKFKTITAPLLGAAIALSFSVATASAALTTSCAGVSSASNITWTATSTGGIDPVSYLWSNGSTSTVQTNTYLPGTHTLGLTATDASSTVATTSCSATVANPLPTISLFTATPATVTAGQSTTLSWNVANASSTSLDNGIGATASTSITVNPLTTTTYTLSAVNGAGTSTATTTVTVLATSTPPTATTTVPLFRRSSLLINDGGQFIAKGMIVESVGTGSFTAKVYGVTFTITSGATVAVGSYVDVKGRIDPALPATIIARSVKTFPSFKVIKVKTEKKEEHREKREEKHDDKYEVRGVNNSTTTTITTTASTNNGVKEIIKNVTKNISKEVKKEVKTEKKDEKKEKKSSKSDKKDNDDR